MTAVVVTLTAAAVGIYSAKTSTGIVGRYIEVCDIHVRYVEKSLFTYQMYLLE